MTDSNQTNLNYIIFIIIMVIAIGIFINSNTFTKENIVNNSHTIATSVKR